jgi:hypothetical protein
VPGSRPAHAILERRILQRWDDRYADIVSIALF